MAVSTPFDAAIDAIRQAGYHNHRLESHSDAVSAGILADLKLRCKPIREDLDGGVIKAWFNVSSPGDRLRKVDLLAGERDADGNPDIERVRLAIENKSVVTGHRNRTNRFDDLKKVLGAMHAARPEALVIATVLVGLCDRVLNIPDQVHKFFRTREEDFVEQVLPRLSSGDSTLWAEFDWAVSRNTANDPARTVELFRRLETRKPGHTHVEGYDYVLLVPVSIDNVNPPSLPRPNPLGIDVDADYANMLAQICSAYTARWHM